MKKILIFVDFTLSGGVFQGVWRPLYDGSFVISTARVETYLSLDHHVAVEPHLIHHVVDVDPVVLLNVL